MDEVTYCTRRAFIPAVLIGSFGGSTILATWTMAGDWSKAWLFPMIILSFGIITLSFVALGLVIFGFPAVWLLRPFLRERWMVLIAAAWGGVAGKIVAAVLLGEPMADFDSLGGLFSIYGSLSGIAWCVFYQRIAEAAEEKDIA